MNTPAIAFSRVLKHYKKQLVLKGLSLTVDAGEFVGLVGVNGAGKTTLLKSLLDFVDVDDGAITIFGTRHRDPGARARLAYLPERFLPPYYVTGKEFLDYTLRMYGVPYVDDNVRAVFSALDLDVDALQKSVREYSKGMAQKLGLAACFLSGKDLFILDEPMSGLDPKARALFKNYLRALKGQGKTLFFSTHMLNDVEELCDRIAILHDGVLRFVGSPQECCARFGAKNLEQAYLVCIDSA